MWKSFFKWNSCLSKEKRKSRDGEIFALYVRGCTEKCKENITLQHMIIFHVDFQHKELFKSLGFFQVIKLCLCWVTRNFIMRTYGMAYTSPFHPWQHVVFIHKKKRLDLKIKICVQVLQDEKVKIRRTVALITVICRCKLMLSVWSFIRQRHFDDVSLVTKN